MKPLDPRLLRYARATRVHIAICVVLGVVTAALVVTQAELLSSGIAHVVADKAGLSSMSGVMVGLALVVVGRTAVAWLQDSASQRSSAVVKSQLRSKIVTHAANLGPTAASGSGRSSATSSSPAEVPNPVAGRRSGNTGGDHSSPAADGQHPATGDSSSPGADADSGRAADDSSGRAAVATLATRGIDALDGYFGRYLPQLVLAVIVPAVVLVRLVPADLTAAVTVLVTLPLIPVFMALVGMATEASNAKRWRALSRLSHHFLDVVSGLVTLKVFGRATAQAESVRRTTDRYRTTTMETLRVAFLSSLVLEMLATLSVALVAVGVGLRLVDGSLSLRTGLLVIILAPEAYLPLRQVGAQYHAAAEGLAAAEQAFAILETPLAVSGSSTDVPDLRAGGSVRVEGVSVSHAGRRGQAPHMANLIACQGEVVVITGASGAGKTTLLAVLLGVVPPTGGGVTIVGDGREVPLSTLALESWRRQLAWVDQTPFLFAGTVADNVRLSRPDATDMEVRRALDTAGLGAMRADRRLEENGTGLSAGERRRVAMARAVLRDAPLILLDEPTAGLDELTESELLVAVRTLAEHSIVIMVSHRPAAIAIADRLVEVRSVEASAMAPGERVDVGSGGASALATAERVDVESGGASAMAPGERVGVGSGGASAMATGERVDVETVAASAMRPSGPVQA